MNKNKENKITAICSFATNMSKAFTKIIMPTPRSGLIKLLKNETKLLEYYRWGAENHTSQIIREIHMKKISELEASIKKIESKLGSRGSGGC